MHNDSYAIHKIINIRVLEIDSGDIENREGTETRIPCEDPE
jgi:hypothetical protein